MTKVLTTQPGDLEESQCSHHEVKVDELMTTKQRSITLSTLVSSLCAALCCSANLPGCHDCVLLPYLARMEEPEKDRVHASVGGGLALERDDRANTDERSMVRCR